MATLPPVRIGVLGLGTVGCGTLNVLKRNGSEIARRAGRSIEVVRASARDLTKSRAADTGGIDLSDDPFALVEDPSIEIIVELIGGTDPARELVLRALDNGKHVVTANKALIALHGNEVFARAQSKGLMVAFEAAVAGGIPVIKAVREALAGNAIEWLAGIINGTCNYMLTAMSERSCGFDEVLSEAQALGYAESDPSFDIDGIDAAHKLTILAAIAFGIPLRFDDVYIEGIRDIALDDVLAQREQINDTLRVRLDEVTVRWGLKVTSVEIREITPPRDIQAAMNRQMTAERERRATVIEAEGSRVSSITIAEGEKQAQILRAEGDRQAQILRAEASQQAQILEADGFSQALSRIFTVAKTVDGKTMGLQYMETLKSLGESPSTKFIFPMEFSNLLQSVRGMFPGATGNGSDGSQGDGS